MILAELSGSRIDLLSATASPDAKLSYLYHTIAALPDAYYEIKIYCDQAGVFYELTITKVGAPGSG